MQELDKNKIYDLSNLTSEELKEIYNATFTPSKRYKFLYFEGYQYHYSDNDFHKTTNAKELFYTLENIQVDCRDLTEEQIKEMCKVYESRGFKKWKDPDAFKIEGSFTYLKIDWENEFYITGGNDNFTTITYEKFIELFGNKEKERIMQELNRWYKYDDGSLFYVTSECKNGHLYGYGFNKDSWVYNIDEGGYECVLNNVAKNYKTPATKEEVEERLKQEAIKRGFIVGAEIGCLSYKEYNRKVLIEEYYLNKKGDEVLWNEFCLDTSLIMKDGVWLDIENEKLPPYKKAPTLVGDVIKGTETTDEVTPINLSSIFSARGKDRKTKIKVLKYLLKRDIILTPKQYKKLWKKF